MILEGVGQVQAYSDLAARAQLDTRADYTTQTYGLVNGVLKLCELSCHGSHQTRLPAYVTSVVLQSTHVFA